MEFTEQMFEEMRRHGATLDQVTQFQGDQAKVNQALSQKMASLETRFEKIERTQRRLIDLLESRTRVGHTPSER